MLQNVGRKCQKTCIANVDGVCSVQECGGPISRVAHRNPEMNVERAAEFYDVMKRCFAECFSEKYVDEDQEE